MINRKNEDIDEQSDEMPTYFFVYIAECADKTYYVGCTNSLQKRIFEHNNLKRGAHYTKIRRPVILKYSEQFPTLLLARRREKEIKGWKRTKKELLWTKAKKRSTGNFTISFL